MEAGNRDDEDRPLAAHHFDFVQQPQSPPRPLRYHYDQIEHHHNDPQDSYPSHLVVGDSLHNYPSSAALNHLPFQLADSPEQVHFDSALAAYAANNSQAADANSTSSIEVVDPDDFYRTYRPHASSGSAEHGDLMASTTLPTQRQNNQGLRPNGNGTTPKHPVIPPAQPTRTGLRPASRSASAPLGDAGKPRPAAGAAYGSSSSKGDGGGGGGGGAGQPSVKDLKRRFDQNAAAQSTNSGTTVTTRKTVPRIPTRETSSASSSSTNYRGVGGPSNANGQSPYSNLPSSVTRDIPPGSGPSSPASASRSTQRNKFVPEDQLSNNAQSFASRISKPRASSSAQGLTSKSMNNLSPTSPTFSTPPVPRLNKSSSSSTSGGRSLLFGEILPGEGNPDTVGYGIDGVRPRRTSESNLHSPTSLHQRSLSHADAELASPTDWYRVVNGTATAHDRSNQGKPPGKLHKGHGRAQSDVARSKPSPLNTKTPLHSRRHPTPGVAPPSASSKLPLSIRKQSSPASSDNSRSNSPSTLKHPPTRTPGKLKTTNPAGTSASRSTSAVRGTSAVRAKTPTLNTPSKRANPPRLGATTPSGNKRLNAYISAPLPKLSPPLRSSRPRQPVSSATTASSRMRAVERGRSPNKLDKTGLKPPSELSTRRRKISMGPIDFESRREQIKLSYTKSIRETEAKAAARKLAAAEKEKEKERRKREALEKAEAERAEAERAAQFELAAIQHAEEEQRQHDLAIAALGFGSEIPFRDQPETQSEIWAQNPESDVPEQLPLTITTDFTESPENSNTAEAARQPFDSPTLGIPGSFPSLASPQIHEETPLSAVSNTTEFDVEPQTEPPQQQQQQQQGGVEESSPLADHSTHDEIPYEIAEPEAQVEERAESDVSRAISEYKSPFEEESVNDSVSIKISLDPSSQDAVQPTPTRSDFSIDPNLPGSYQDDDEYVPQPFVAPSYETTVTIIHRESGFSPTSLGPDGASDTLAVPSAHDELAEADDRNDHSRSSRRSSLGEVVHSSNEHSDQDSGLEKLEEFYVGPNVADSAARLRDSSSSIPPGHTEVGHSRTWPPELAPEATRFSTETPRTAETQPGLNVPRTLTPPNRTSQNTVWTDFSIDSKDGYSDMPPKLPHDDVVYRQRGSVSETASRSQSIQYDRDSKMFTSSPGSSPHGSYRSTMLSDTNKQHQLPELDTGGGFVVDYMPRKNSTVLSTVPVLPDHSPPAPPEEATFPDVLSSAPPSEYYNDTRPSSYFLGDQSSISVSRPQSETFDHTDSALHSIDQGSFETSEGVQSSRPRLDSQQTLADSIDQNENSSGLPPKERKRLFTRLETIKELIDTEAFFIRDMNIVEEIYKGTAEACPQLDDKTIKLIFRNTDQIIAFHSSFLSELKEGVSSVYIPKGARSVAKDGSSVADGSASISNGSPTATGELSDARDRETSLGPIFSRNMEQMKIAHETFLKNSDHAAKRLIQIQEDPTVKVWLNECNEVARDLTKAWNLDSLLIKPMQRITKYPNLLIQVLHETPADHPDRHALESAKACLEEAIEEINKTKKNFELVGQIVGRKRKESDVRAGFARAFGKRVDKLQPANNRPPEDSDYQKLHEKFGDDYLRLQVVLRDVEFYTRTIATYVHEFLQYLSSMELVMRLQPSPHPEIESKWVRFNVSMRDVEKVALEQHLSQVRKHVIEPFELVIKSYGNPSLAMKKRAKRRLDYEKSIQLKKAGKKLDKQLSECVEQYDALNEALKKELPKLSALTERVGNICLGNFVNIQAQWYSIWKEKVKIVLDNPQVPEIADIVSTFQRDYKFQDEQVNAISIVNPAYKGRASHSTGADDVNPGVSRVRPRPSELSSASSTRGRGLSINSDVAPSLPTPDFGKRHSGQFTVSPTVASASMPSPAHQFYYSTYRDYYSGINGQSRGSASPMTPDLSASSRSLAAGSMRPGTGQSYDSNGAPRQSSDSGAQARRYSNSIYPSSGYQMPDNQRYSGLFQSALPLPDGPEKSTRQSRTSSRASSRERQPINGYNVLWLAASLFEFNIETTKHEAGYPYLTYQAGEIFDVIGEKGELWLAKNQDDPSNLVGWLWSKHFAKLADD
ncbi:uncharacterized protein BCR38DRAFT_483492 [Pseudomassariella vexata]|uniref:DH domain-containing protein n=1 Tax=Pseudomassariella vexata TaxID=1141098 RepID=A0A1Y2E2P5_9PEZI|nr:uncharacterized protein BCR38DRAFT_483492 [Pseudomassariella vexata]ORY65813.1 hypothetical protein BCR38DRAFT_483492 [Pseudomassariella vexata]